MSAPRREPPAPVEVNDVAVIAVGMVLWLVALGVLWFGFRGDLRAHHASWWLWTCVAGFGLGFYGIGYGLLRRRRLTDRDRTPPAGSAVPRGDAASR